MGNCPYCGEATWTEGKGCEFRCHERAELQAEVSRQARRIEQLEARVAAADKLAEAGSVMSRALQGDYIVPGSAAKWDAALAAYEATKEQSE